MVALSMKSTFVLVISLVGATLCFASKWPVPYQRVNNRPKADSYCQAGVIPFCPTGIESNAMPNFDDADRIEIYAMKKPVWEFKFGNLLKKFNIMHDAIGVKNLKTGKNYTMEWYELFQLFNCTFPHLRGPQQDLEWCNQGALCIYEGIEDIIWSQNGTLVKVAEMSGSQFNDFSNYALWDNMTGIFYETWTVKSGDNSPKEILYFDSWDCASWVIRAFHQMASVGAAFDQSIHLNYTRISLFSNEPVFLGNYSVISQNKTLLQSIKKFYSTFQKKSSYMQLAMEILEDLRKIFISKAPFYFYFNSEYWALPLTSPHLKLTYNMIPLPGKSKGDNSLKFQSYSKYQKVVDIK